MYINPVVYLTTHRTVNQFIRALKSCASLGEIRLETITTKNVKALPQTYPALLAQRIVESLNVPGQEVIIDGVGLENSILLLGIYSGALRNNRDKLSIVVYDPFDPDRAEVASDLHEAVKLVYEYGKTIEISER